MSGFQIVLSGLLFAVIGGSGVAQELPPLDPQPGRESTGTTTSSAKQDVVIKGFMPDRQVSRLVQEAFDEVEKARKQKAAKAAASKKASELKKSSTAKKSSLDPKAASLIAEPAKVGTLATPEEKAIAKKAQEAADRANGIVSGQKRTEKPAERPEANKTASAKALNLDSKPVALDGKKEASHAKAGKSESTKVAAKPKQPARENGAPEPEKTVVRNIEIAPGKNMTVKSSVSSDIEQSRPFASSAGSVTKTGRNGQLQITGRVVSVRYGQGGRLRVLIDAGDEGSVQALIDPHIGMRVPRQGSLVSASGKRIGGSGNSLVVRVQSLTSRSGSTTLPGTEGKKRYRPEVAELVPEHPLRGGGVSVGPAVDLSTGHIPHPMYAPPVMGPLVPPPPPFW